MVSFSPCECLPIFIWSFLLNVDVFNVSSVNCLHHTCLPIASRKFLTMRMSSRHFLEVTYLLCMSSKQLSLQTGGSFPLCKCPPITTMKFPAQSRWPPCIIWKLPTSCRYLPTSRRKFSHLANVFQALKLPTYCVCLRCCLEVAYIR